MKWRLKTFSSPINNYNDDQKKIPRIRLRSRFLSKWLPRRFQLQNVVDNQGISRKPSYIYVVMVVDVRCKKRRVRFADLPNHKLPAEALSSSFVTSETNQPPKSDDPKTSEYAFFKKLKEDAVHRFHTHSLEQDICCSQLNKFKSTDCSKERSNLMEDGAQDFRPPLLNANVTPEKFISSTLLGNASKKSGVCMNGAGTISDNVQVLENMEEREFRKNECAYS